MMPRPPWRPRPLRMAEIARDPAALGRFISNVAEGIDRIIPADARAIVLVVYKDDDGDAAFQASVPEVCLPGAPTLFRTAAELIESGEVDDIDDYLPGDAR